MQNHKEGPEGWIVTKFHIWLDADFMTLILGAHLEIEVIL